MTESHSALPPGFYFAPERLDYIASHARPRRKGPRFFLSMAGSSTLHALTLTILVLNPHLLLVNKNWFRDVEGPPDDAYQMITYVPTSDDPMYLPRQPLGELYSSQDTLAISQPPGDQSGDNLMPYSRGTTEEPLITDIVEKLEPKEPGEKPAPTATEVTEQQQKAGETPVLQLPPSDNIPTSQAMVLPAKTDETRVPPIKIGDPAGSPDGAIHESRPTMAQPDEQSRIRVAEDIAQRLKMQDIGQRIFENEASALRSEGSGFFDTRGFELSSYSQFVVDKIKQNWLIPAPARNETGRSTIIFYIEKDGEISGIRLVAASGRRDLDQAALNSILGSSPFPPLPRDFTGEHIGAKLIFSYNEVRNIP